MGCLLGCLALAFPRIALVLVWLFLPGYLARAIEPWYWGLLGFLFLPTTTLAFVYGINSLGAPGEMPPLGWVLVALGGIFDLGLTERGYRGRSRRREG